MRFVCEKIEGEGYNKKFTLSNEFVQGYVIEIDLLKRLIKSNKIVVENLKLTASDALILNKNYKVDTQQIDRIISLTAGYGIKSSVAKVSSGAINNFIRNSVDKNNNIKLVKFEAVKDLNGYLGKLKLLNTPYVVLQGTDMTPRVIAFEVSNSLRIVSDRQIIIVENNEYVGYRGGYGDFDKFNYDLDIKGLHLENLRSLRYFFEGIRYRNVTIENLDLSNVIDVNNMFANSCIKNLILRNIKLDNLESCENMFFASHIQNLLIENIDLPKLRTVASMFDSADIQNIVIRHVRSYNIMDATRMFYRMNRNFSLLDELTRISFDNCDISTENLAYVSEAFCEAHMKDLNLSFFTNRNCKLISTFKMFYDAVMDNVIMPNLNIDCIPDTRLMFNSVGIGNIVINNAIERATTEKSVIAYKKKKAVRDKSEDRVITVPASLIAKLNETYCEDKYDGQGNIVKKNRVVPLQISRYYKKEGMNVNNSKLTVSQWTIKFKKVESIKELRKSGYNIKNIASNLYLYVDESNKIINILSEFYMTIGTRNGVYSDSAFANTHFYCIDLSGTIPNYKMYRDYNGINIRVDIVKECITHRLVYKNCEIKKCDMNRALESCYIDELDMQGTTFDSNVTFSKFNCVVGILNSKGVNIANDLKKHVINVPADESLDFVSYLAHSVTYQSRTVVTGIMQLI